jgi:hypothetical protein
MAKLLLWSAITFWGKLLNFKLFHKILCTVDYGLLSCRLVCPVDFAGLRKRRAAKTSSTLVSMTVCLMKLLLYKCKQTHCTCNNACWWALSLLMSYQTALKSPVDCHHRCQIPDHIISSDIGYTERGQKPRLAPAALYPPGKKLYPLYRKLGGPQGRSGQVRKISSPPGFDPRTVQPVASRYTDWATRPGQHRLCYIKLTGTHSD